MSRSIPAEGGPPEEGGAPAKGPERRESGRRRAAGKVAAVPGGDAGVERTETRRGRGPRGGGTRRTGAPTRPAAAVEKSAGRKRKARGTRGPSDDGAEEDEFVEELDGLGRLDGEEDARTHQQSESKNEEDEEGEEEEEGDDEEGGEEEETEEETDDFDESGGGGDPTDEDEGAGEEEAEGKRKTRIFEVVHWALRSIVKMGMCTLVEAIGLWQLQASGASAILTGQKETAPGGQSCRLLKGSDVFHEHAPLAGNEEQMAQDGTPEWRIKPEQEEGVLCYLKTADHVDKTSKWIDRLMRWNHVALKPLRKVVCGGLVVLPGPVALDLRGAVPTAYAMPDSTKKARLAFLQSIAARNGELGDGHARSELAFIYEFKHPSPPFQVQDFVDRAAVERGMQPFRELLRQLKISLDDERFLLKWLVLAVRRKEVPALMVQSPILSRLLLYTFISPAAVCNLKMHEALPAHSPSALSYVAIKCSDVGATLHTTSPLCNVLEQRQARHELFERNEVGSPAPPILLDCAPGHIPALAAGAGIGTVRVVRSGLDAAGYRKVDDKYQWDPVNRAAVQRSIVFAAIRGAQLLQSDKGLLMEPKSPPLLSELGPHAGKVLKPRLPFKKDTFRQVLLAVLESIEHTDIIAYDSTDSKGVDLRMLCTVVFLLWAPLKWKTFCEEKKRWRDLFDEVAEEAAKRGRADIVRERMFQAGQRGSPLGKRIEALGSCSVYDAVASPDHLAEQSGGQRILRMQIVADELEAIFPEETLERYRTCLEGECSDGDGQRHLRDLCALKHRLARRKAMRESPLALFTSLKEKLEARFVEEFPNEEIPFEETNETADGVEKYVKRLTDDILRLRQRAATQAEG